MPGTASPTSGPYSAQDIQNWVLGTLNSDAQSTAQVGFFTVAGLHLYDGSGGTWNRQRNNYEEVTFASTARATGTLNSADFINYNARGVAMMVEISVGSASGTLGTINVQAKIGTSYQTVASFPTMALTTGTAMLLVYPGAASTGGWTQAPIQGVIPRNWRAQLIFVTTTATLTFSMTHSYVV